MPSANRAMVHRLFRTGEAETNRVEAFSDGVFAIVLTILVLEVKVPQHVTGGDAALWHALSERLPVIGAWVVSFLFVLVFWVAHHYFFAALSMVDRGLLWLNGLLLLTISFIPFPTALAGEYPGATPAVFMLSLAMFLTAASFSLMRWYASFVGRLISTDVPEAELKAAMRKSLVAPALYSVGILMSYMDASRDRDPGDRPAPVLSPGSGPSAGGPPGPTAERMNARHGFELQEQLGAMADSRADMKAALVTEIPRGSAAKWRADLQRTGSGFRYDARAGGSPDGYGADAPATRCRGRGVGTRDRRSGSTSGGAD